jgi:hypothetical protein
VLTSIHNERELPLLRRLGTELIMAWRKWSYAGLLALAACAALVFAQGAFAASGGGCDADYRHSGYGTSARACVGAGVAYDGGAVAVPDAYVYVTPGLETRCTVTVSMFHNTFGLLSTRAHNCQRSSGIVRYAGYSVWVNSGAVHVLASVNHYYAGAWRNAASWTPWLYMP